MNRGLSSLRLQDHVASCLLADREGFACVAEFALARISDCDKAPAVRSGGRPIWPLTTTRRSFCVAHSRVGASSTQSPEKKRTLNLDSIL